MTVLIKEFKITDKNYGGSYIIYKNHDYHYFFCTTPKNVFGYEDIVHLDHVMKFDDENKYAGTETIAVTTWRYLPNWILVRIKEELVKLTVAEGW